MDKISRIPDTADTPRSILVVDDDDRVLLFISRMLTAIGHSHVYTASSSAEASDLWKAHSARIWLVITDFVMPNGNGDELAANLLEQQPGLSILFISGNDPDALDSRVPLHPGKNFLQKPFTMTEVRDIIGRALAARAGQTLARRSETATPEAAIVSFPAQ